MGSFGGLFEPINEFYAMDYDDLESRRDALSEAIHSCDPMRNSAVSHIITDSRIPLLSRMDEALEILGKARKMLAEKRKTL